MKYKLNEERVFSDVSDGIAILINMENGVYYGLNQFTTNIYENIVNGADTEDLLAALSKVKGYSDDIKSKYLEFLNELIIKEFIIENVAASATVHLDFDEYLNDDLDFVLSEYRDVSELLLADPIHQVKEELGWQPDKEALK